VEYTERKPTIKEPKCFYGSYTTTSKKHTQRSNNVSNIQEESYWCTQIWFGVNPIKNVCTQTKAHTYENAKIEVAIARVLIHYTLE
jgi:hypothetical protein